MLDQIIAERGKPLAIRCDNGPELTSRHILAWSVDSKVELRHIQPGKPTQNAYVESFHGRLREECLRVSWFTNLFDARRKISNWKTEYNEERPHSSLGYRTPSEFAAIHKELSYAKDVGFAHLEKRCPRFPPCHSSRGELYFVGSGMRKLGAGQLLSLKARTPGDKSRAAIVALADRSSFLALSNRRSSLCTPRRTLPQDG